MNEIEEKLRHQNPFSIMPADLINDAEITPMQKMVYMALASYMNAERICYPYIQTISSKLGVSYRTVTRALSVLKEAGYVATKNQWRDNGGQVANVYYLPLNPRTSVSYPLGHRRPTPRTPVSHLTIQSELDINFNKFKKARTRKKEKSTDVDFNEAERQKLLAKEAEQRAEDARLAEIALEQQKAKAIAKYSTKIS